MMASLQSSSVGVSSAASHSESCDDGVTHAFTSLSLGPPENSTIPALPSLRVLPAESSSSRPMEEDESNKNVTVALQIGPTSSVDRIASMVRRSEMRSEAGLPPVPGFTIASVYLIAPAPCDRRIFQVQTRKRKAELGTLGTIMEGSEVADVRVSACLRWSEHNAKIRKGRAKLGVMETIMEGRPLDPDSMTSMVP